MKQLFVIAVISTLASGCTTTVRDSYAQSIYANPNTYGYKSYDPCIRCGEGWIFLNLDDTTHLKGE